MTRTIKLTVSAAVLVAVAVLISSVLLGPATADDRRDNRKRGDSDIVWNPPRLDLSVRPNETVQLPVTFTAQEKLDDRMTIFATTSLTESVNVTPTTFGSLRKGQTATVTIAVKLSILAQPGTTTGFIQLYEQEGKKRPEPISKALPISITTLCPCLPSDPGEAGKATIEGIDSDGDGVRDDVQRFIAVTYPNSEKARSALRQDAVYTQKALLTQTREQTRALIPEMTRAQECLEYLGVTDAARKATTAVLINTPERYRAWAADDARTSGAGWMVRDIPEWKTSCVFDPDTLPN
jgi:hypothetical protein